MDVPDRKLQAWAQGVFDVATCCGSKETTQVEDAPKVDPKVFAVVHAKTRDSMDMSDDASLQAHAGKLGHNVQAIKMEIVGSKSVRTEADNYADRKVQSEGLTETNFMLRARCTKHSYMKVNESTGRSISSTIGGLRQILGKSRTNAGERASSLWGQASLCARGVGSEDREG